MPANPAAINAANAKYGFKSAPPTRHSKCTPEPPGWHTRKGPVRLSSTQQILVGAQLEKNEFILVELITIFVEV